MSHRDWLHTLGRLNFACGILAARGDDHDSLLQTAELCSRLEATAYRPAVPPDVVMPDALYSVFDDTSTKPVYVNPDIFTFDNYTPRNPFPVLPAPSGAGTKGKKKARKVSFSDTVIFETDNALRQSYDRHCANSPRMSNNAGDTTARPC